MYFIGLDLVMFPLLRFTFGRRCIDVANLRNIPAILLTMIFTSLWETFDIFYRTAIDSSMIGFGIFGLLVL